MSIANESMLVNITMSVWTGRKLDKQVSAEVDVAKSTKTRAGNYHKNLFAGVDELAAVGRISGKIRNWFHEQTLPWSDGGDRLLTMNNFKDFKRQLGVFEVEFADAVKTFCDKYSTLISAQAFTMGALFDRSEYPDVDDIANKFNLRYTFSPVPEVGDWRVDADAADKKELEKHYEKSYNDRISSTTRDLWDRLHGVLTHMADRLADTTEGKGKIFRDTLLESPVKLCELLTKLNVTNDPKLEAARKSLESAILNVEIKDLRESKGARLEVKTQVDEILKRFDF
ncbi:MAG: hypothetical protein JW384_03730 [Nitrosomonadaceae bacterium]|nr:hypothetical protein [Nitrosomonadaceae bacterium]